MSLIDLSIRWAEHYVNSIFYLHHSKYKTVPFLRGNALVLYSVAIQDYLLVLCRLLFLQDHNPDLTGYHRIQTALMPVKVEMNTDLLLHQRAQTSKIIAVSDWLANPILYSE